MKKAKQIITILIIFFIVAIVINRILKIKKIRFPRNNNLIVINTNFNNNEKPESEEPVSNHIGDSDKFGLHVNMRNQSEIDFSLAAMDDLDVNKVRIWENWAIREPSPGQYNWTALDMRINSFYNAGKKILLTIKPTGIMNGQVAWYCQEDTVSASGDACLFKSEYEDDFANYIKNIMTRYNGKIDIIQFHNEWDSDYHFKGSGDDYAKYANIFYNAVKQVSPNTKVLLGSITKSPLLYIAGCDLNILNEFYDKTGQLISSQARQSWCNNSDAIAMKEKVSTAFAQAKYDMVDIHLYDDPQYWDEYMIALKTININNKPVIATEFGGPWAEDSRINPYNENDQAIELQRYIDKMNELPIVEAYYFKLIEGGEANHPLTGLMKQVGGSDKPVPKVNYNIFKNRLQ